MMVIIGVRRPAFILRALVLCAQRACSPNNAEATLMVLLSTMVVCVIKLLALVSESQLASCKQSKFSLN
jgi:hypothetical protein